MELTYRDFLKQESEKYSNNIVEDLKTLDILLLKGDSTLTKEYTEIIKKSPSFVENYGTITIDFHEGLNQALNLLENNSGNVELIKALASIHRKISHTINVIAHKIKEYEAELF